MNVHTVVYPQRNRRPALLLLGATGILLSCSGLVEGSLTLHEGTNTASRLPVSLKSFLSQNCAGCHNEKTASGGLNLAKLVFQPANATNHALWVKLHDRVSAGEMPPKGAPQPTPAARQAFLSDLARPLTAVQAAHAKAEGRATLRRLNRYEYENTLRDLLGAPWLQIKEMLPEDGLLHRLNKSGEALAVSHVQMSRYLAAADYALREALAQPMDRPEVKPTRYYARDMRSFANLVKEGKSYPGSTARATFPIVGNEADLGVLDGTAPMTVGDADPAKREKEAMGVVASAYEPIQPRFDRFRAPSAGRYKLRLSAHTFWSGPGDERRWWFASQRNISGGRTREPVSLYGSMPPERLRKLGSFDVGPEPTVNEIDVYLLKGETILPDAVRFFRSRPPSWRNPLATAEGQPGVAFQWLEVEGPIYDGWPTQGRRLLFGDLPLKEANGGGVEFVPRNPESDSERLMRAFLKRAIRRPVQEADAQPFLRLVRDALASGNSFTESMLAGYSAVLCSPAFVTLEERPGLIDDHALASRLSYFLWNSEPDSALRALADQGKLREVSTILAQADRMLADPRSGRFVEAFLDYWLDLRKADDTSPDENLYPDYYLDDFLRESSVEETRAFFAELLRRDLPSRNLVDSDFVMVNGRLARLYGLEGVEGAAIRRVPLPKDSARGGLLTQASVLKVTANGTTTSPVLRGVWVIERILGMEIPPPPPTVSAIDPDIRGATTIREQLDKHRSVPACQPCHVKIDPPGFALESFDIFGGWRERYRALGEGEKAAGYGKNGQPFAFHAALPVDSSGILQDGRRFKDIKEFKRLLAQDDRGIARNLARELIIYSTGAAARFADRPAVEGILNRSQSGGYGVRSIVRGIIGSELFRSK